MSAANGPILFENYAYGMTRDEVIASSGASACPEAPANRLLLCASDPANFLGISWREMFWFNNLDELQQIMLIRPDEPIASLAQAQDALTANGWRAVFLETDGVAFDALEETRRRKAEDVEKAREDFEARALREKSGLTIYFFPAEFAQKGMGKAKSYSQAVDSAGETFVMISLMLDGDNLKLAFTAPLLARKNALRYGQIIKR